MSLAMILGAQRQLNQTMTEMLGVRIDDAISDGVSCIDFKGI